MHQKFDMLTSSAYLTLMEELYLKNMMHCVVRIRSKICSLFIVVFELAEEKLKEFQKNVSIWPKHITNLFKNVINLGENLIEKH